MWLGFDVNGGEPIPHLFVVLTGTGESMKTVLAQSTVVVVAHDVNLSIFRPVWLGQNDILTEEELAGEVVVTPVAINVPAGAFNLMIVPNRVQISFSDASANVREVLDRIVGGIVRTLPHTPYSGCGMNFHHFVANTEGDFGDWCRSNFASTVSNRMMPVSAEDPRCGTYVSLDVLGGRLKLDMKPVKIPEGSVAADGWEDQREAMKFSFNYDFSVADSEKPNETLLEVLSRWDDALAHSHTIVASEIGRASCRERV